MDWLKQSLADVEAEFNLSVSSPAKKVNDAVQDGAGISGDEPKTSTPVMPRKTRSSSSSSSRNSSRRNTDDTDKGSDWSSLLDTPNEKPNAAAAEKSDGAANGRDGGKDGSPLKAENVKLKKLLMKLKKENASLMEIKDTSSAAPTENESDPALATIKQSLEASAAENSQLKDAVEASKQEATKLKKFSLKLKKENVELKNKVTQLEQQLTDDAKDATSDAGANDSQLQELRDQIAAYVQQLEASKAEVTALTQQCEDAKAEQDSTQAMLDRERDTVAQVEEQSAASATRLQKEIDSVSAQLARALEATSAAEDQEDSFATSASSAEVDELTAINAQLLKEKDTLAAEIASLRQSLAEQASPNATQTGDVTDESMTALSAKNTELEAEVAALQKKYADLKSTSGSGDAALADAQTAHATLATETASLRAQIDELTDALQSAEAVKSELQAQHEDENSSMLASVQQAQEQCRDLMEQVEKQTILLREAETKAQENADAAAEAQAAVRDELVRVTAERNRLQSELSSVAETNDALESESRDAVSELAAECSTLRTQVQQLEVTKARLTTQLEQEQESHATTRDKLSNASVDASNLSMLDLEIADYKRTVESLNKKIADMSEQQEQHQAAMQEREGKIAELTSTRAREEELKGKDEQTRLKLKTLLLKTKKELTEKRAETERLDKANRDQLDAVETKNQEIEALKTDIAELNVQLNTIEATQREADTTKDMQMHSLKFELETSRRECKQFQTQAHDLQKELQNYKARAHTLLKQKTDENAPTKDTVEALQADLSAAKEALTAAEGERDEHRTQCDTLGADFDELLAKFETTDQELQLLKTTTTAQIRDLEDANTLLEQRQVEVLSELRLEQSMALRSQKDRHAQQLRDLHARQQLTDAELDRVRAALDDAGHGRDAEGGTAVGGVVGGGSTATPTNASPGGRDMAGAGARPATASATSATPPTATAAPVASATDLHRHVSTGTKVATAVSDLATLLVTPPAPSGAESGGDALAAAQAHIAHLATLLAESESTVERMVEQSKVLKQEIRRHEKNSEREEDAKNLEYIKNVVYKFITAHEEKAQLIPVMGMLLKFTPEEVQNATKGFQSAEVEKQQAAAHKATAENWSVFSRWG